MLVPPLAALHYPFDLKAFNASVTCISEAGACAFALPRLTAAVSLALAFPMPLIAMPAAMPLWATWTRSSFSHGRFSASTPGGASPCESGAMSKWHPAAVHR